MNPPPERLPPSTRRDTSVPMTPAEFERQKRLRALRIAVPAVLALSVVGWLLWQMARPAERAVSVAEAEDLVSKAQYGPAVAVLDGILAERPDHADALRARALALLEMGDTAGAARDLGRLIRLAPNDAVAYRLRARQRVADRQLDGAIQDWSRAIDVSPRAADYAARAAALRETGHVPEALADLDRAIDLDPRPEHLVQRGQVHEALGDSDKALADFTRAIGIRPDFAVAYRFRGALFEKLGQKEKAAEDRRRANQIEGIAGTG